jgi:hypothetical protein
VRTRASVWTGALLLGVVVAGICKLAYASAIGAGTREKPAFFANNSAVVTGTLTRPADTTQYSAGDEVTDTGAAILEITGCSTYNGGSGRIKWIEVIGSVNAATDPDLDIFLYDTTSTPEADNAAFAPSDAVSNTNIYAADLGTAVQSGANNIVFRKGELDIPYVCGSSSKSLFARFVERSTYTPASGEIFKVRIGVTRD